MPKQLNCPEHEDGHCENDFDFFTTTVLLFIRIVQPIVFSRCRIMHRCEPLYPFNNIKQLNSM